MLIRAWFIKCQSVANGNLSFVLSAVTGALWEDDCFGKSPLDCRVGLDLTKFMLVCKKSHLVPKWQFGLEARAQPYFAFKEWDRLLPLLILVSELQQISRLFYHWTTVVAWLGKPYYKKRPRHLGIARKGGGCQPLPRWPVASRTRRVINNISWKEVP